jgi:hypothetical protein
VLFSLNQGQYALIINPSPTPNSSVTGRNDVHSFKTNNLADVDCNSVQVSPECISKFNELKLGKSVKYIIYKLSDDYKQIVVEEASENPDWDVFREKLINAKSKGMGGKEVKGPRYAVYDFSYDLASGEGSRYEREP